MLWKQPFECLARRLNGVVNRANDMGNRAELGNMGGLVLGMTMGAVWTPCAGPVLGSILTLVAMAHDLGRATTLLLCYSVGAGIPMLAIAYGGQHMTTRVRRVARHAARMQLVFGELIILTAIAMYFQYKTMVTSWLSTLLPNLAPGS
jgi:cytochrome c biogenesis protein CcdA